MTAGKAVRPEQAGALLKMTCASGTNGLRNGQNDLRDLAKWFAQLAKWFAPHFENNERPWENDLRVGLRLICAWFALDLCERGGGACSAAQIIFHLIQGQVIGPSLGGSH